MAVYSGQAPINFVWFLC